MVAPPDRRVLGGAAEGFAWVQILGEARANARPLARLSVLMMVAGIIAALGVIEENPILIVGAMAVSPDLLPICAACVGLVGRRLRLVRQSLVTLAVALALAALIAGVLTGALQLRRGLRRRGLEPGWHALGVLGVNVACLLLSGGATLDLQQLAARRYPVSGRR